ncbi:hypothetical protein LCGC14_1420760 [marine sediment metagenome]|uniref:Uncharacterized protein n=1 Tax=marine sediment metagenome TaxID=412755 RepID=A0A0F9JRY7_9ZZZZ
MNANCGHPQDWFQCYAGSHDLWVPEAYAHPAKMSPALCQRILTHLKELGLLTAEDTILDFMCGIGTTVLLGALAGNPAVGVELEPKFVDLCVSYWCLGIPKVTVTKVILPPDDGGWRTEKVTGKNYSRLYYVRPVMERIRWKVSNQCRCGKLDWHPVHWVVGNIEYVSKKVGRELPVTIIRGDARHLSDLLCGGLDKGLIAITSPPYGDALGDWKNKDSNMPGQFYSEGFQNIENLPETLDPGQRTKADWWRKKALEGCKESYLDAMRQVYAEAFKVCDVLAVVTKNPTRNGKLRDLAGDTRRLLEEVGFTIHCVHRAILFEELEGGHMFEGSQKKVKGRLSFFKRLSYQKGSPVAQWEDVVIAVRDGGGLKGITSPPYQGNVSDSANDPYPERQEGTPAGRHYGQSPGQIGNLKDRPHMCGIVSPPYGTGEGLGHAESQPSATEKYAGTRYGQTDGQIGNL